MGDEAMVQRGDRVVRFELSEGKLAVVGGTVLNEAVAGSPVSISYDDGEMVDLVQESAAALPAEGACVACGTELHEGHRFCRKCGASNVYEDVSRTASYLLTHPGPGTIQERLVAAAKARLGAPAASAKAVPAGA